MMTNSNLTPKQLTLVTFLVQNAFVERKDMKANNLSEKAANALVEMHLAKWDRFPLGTVPLPENRRPDDKLVIVTKAEPAKKPPRKVKQPKPAEPPPVEETPVEPHAEHIDEALPDEDVSAEVREATETAAERAEVAAVVEQGLADGSVDKHGRVIDDATTDAEMAPRCLCGCGEPTKLVNPKRKNSKRRLFVQGHDARLKGWFLKVIRGEMPVAEFPVNTAVMSYLLGAPWCTAEQIADFRRIAAL